MEVKATSAAQDAVKRLNVLLNGQLESLIEQLNNEGKILANPENWKGPKASEFRTIWPGMHKTAVKLKQDIDELQKRAKQITDEIMRAGGA
jgi:uncharacterized protein YukE